MNRPHRSGRNSLFDSFNLWLRDLFLHCRAKLIHRPVIRGGNSWDRNDLLHLVGEPTASLFPSDRLQGQKENPILPLVRLNIQRKEQDLVDGQSNRHSVGHDKDTRNRLPVSNTSVRGGRDS